MKKFLVKILSKLLDTFWFMPLLVILISVIFMVIAYKISYMIAVSDLPFWVKFFLLN